MISRIDTQSSRRHRNQRKKHNDEIHIIEHIKARDSSPRHLISLNVKHCANNAHLIGARGRNAERDCDTRAEKMENEQTPTECEKSGDYIYLHICIICIIRSLHPICTHASGAINLFRHFDDLSVKGNVEKARIEG